MDEDTIYKTALSKSMALCSRRELCCDDIRNKLVSWGVGSNDAEKIINILIKENFISESRYAAAFVKDKFNYNKWGKIKIASHLKAKKIPSDLIRSALDSIDNDIYIKTLNNIITGHIKNVKAKTRYELKAKLLRYGLSKGFESALLYDLLNDIEE